MVNDLVRYSRAGDEFHYIWAARRCLQMVLPSSKIEFVTIEGPTGTIPDGEYIIDVGEYTNIESKDGFDVSFIQLKHTSVRTNDPFVMSDLKDAIEGFAKIYESYVKGELNNPKVNRIKFRLVTNRPVNKDFKNRIIDVSLGKSTLPRFYRTLASYTKMNNTKLKEFCSVIEFIDNEGDYRNQKFKLASEVNRFIPSPVSSPHIDSIVGLIREKALTSGINEIRRVDILEKLGAPSERDLFPAPRSYDRINKIIERDQIGLIITTVYQSNEPVIVHAAGGVGKSIIAQQIITTLPNESFGILYDCFGNGQYRNHAKPRHRCRDALVQIVNELSIEGLCDPLIPLNDNHDDQLLREFIDRLSVSIKSLRANCKQAILVIIIDAADNAEMAAKEVGGFSFAHSLLTVSLPEGCRLVELCRTERLDMLHPNSKVIKIELSSFNERETFQNLKLWFPDANDDNAREFYRLTNNGNPRVQANALNQNHDTMVKLLTSLGPYGTSVDEQIELQLKSALDTLKDNNIPEFIQNIDKACCALATLPPSIPMEVLAKIAKIEEREIVSLVSDIGRSLWILDKSVQFRDEPTETWYRKKFAADKGHIRDFVRTLKPLAENSGYVASALPSLMWQADMYVELVELALSDNYLPINSIDRRNIRVYRLHFAYKAALKIKDYSNTIKLAFLSGDEIAGDKRQMSMIANNIDIVSSFYSEAKIQELAYQHKLKSAWIGSENTFSSALLASIESCKGEARSYFRTAQEWLNKYLEDRKKKKKHDYHEDKLSDNDIFVMMYTVYKLEGVIPAIEFIIQWKPNRVVFDVSRRFFRYIIDVGDYAVIEGLQSYKIKSSHVLLALTHELLDAGIILQTTFLNRYLGQFINPKCKEEKTYHDFEDKTFSALVSFAEVCAANDISEDKILIFLEKFTTSYSPFSITSPSQYSNRFEYLRSIALVYALKGITNINIDKIVTDNYGDKEGKSTSERDTRDFREIVGCLLPWYLLRIQLIMNQKFVFDSLLRDTIKASEDAKKNRYNRFDVLPNELSKIWIDLFSFTSALNQAQLNQLYIRYLENNNGIWIEDRIKAVRNSNRLSHVSGFKAQLEESARESFNRNDGPETISAHFVLLSRAVLSNSIDDASAYFNYGIEAVSKFGNEVAPRWEACVSIAEQASKSSESKQELAFRFIRCAELVGDYAPEEKYWDSRKAFRACVKLSPVGSFTASSRWRERDVGDYDIHVCALAEELVISGTISPLEGWSMNPLLHSNYVDDLLTTCIKHSKDYDEKNSLFDKGIDFLRKNNISTRVWIKLNEFADDQNIENMRIKQIVDAINNNEKDDKQSTDSIVVDVYKGHDIDWEIVFEDSDLTTTKGIESIYNKYMQNDSNKGNWNFWDKVLERVSENNANKFLESLIDVKDVDLFSMMSIFERIPTTWKQKVSIKDLLPNLMKQIGLRYATSLAEHDSLKYCQIRLEKNGIDCSQLESGMLEGLTEHNNYISSRAFYGSAMLLSKYINQDEAVNLLGFSLRKFENYIDNEYADGIWNDSLSVHEDIYQVYALYIWVALGSPDVEIRWRAMHCIRELVDNGAYHIVYNIVDCICIDRAEAFIHRDYPFYYLHAKLYLLIALARVSQDKLTILLKYSDLFRKLALEDNPHVLFRKYAAEIALSIERKVPRTYSQETKLMLEQINKSQFLPVEGKKYDNSLNSPWHEDGKFIRKGEFHFDYDFEQYWLSSLGEVFGITGKQVEDLASNVICDEWGVISNGYDPDDPRNDLWRSFNSNPYRRKSTFSHSGYPTLDDYAFYLSYHSMLTVAAKLVDNMPVVRFESDWKEDEWVDWLKNQTLTREDGCWLSDRRDAIPIEHSIWSEDNHNEMKLDISNDDFVNSVITYHGGDVWLNVGGYLFDQRSYITNHVTIYSALVQKELSQSLLNALSTCTNPYDANLERLTINDDESNLNPFELVRLFYYDGSDRQMDKLDPLAADISYPPIKINQSIIEQLKLTSDLELREWKIEGNKDVSMHCDIWSSEEVDTDGDRLHHGMIMKSSLYFLQQLCSVLDCEIILKVEISRRYKHNYGSDNSSKDRYPQFKLFIISQEGDIRDEREYIRIRQFDC